MNNHIPKAVVFASGSKDGGGSGFENLVTHSEQFGYQIVAVVSNHLHGGVCKRADKLGVPFVYFAGPYTAENYQKIVDDCGAEYVALSGWLKMAQGLNPQKTFNIHPALLSYKHGKFGGPGLYGHHVHDAVKRALDDGEIQESGCAMHFVTDEYDRGPIFFECRVPICAGMSANEIANAVNEAERKWQPQITGMVMRGQISWDGKNPDSLVAPEYCLSDGI